MVVPVNQSTESADGAALWTLELIEIYLEIKKRNT